MPLLILTIVTSYVIAWALYLQSAQSDSKFTVPYSPVRVIKVNLAFWSALLGWITELPIVARFLYWRYFLVKDTFRQIVRRDIQYSSAHPSCKLDVYLPDETTNAPIVVYIYGGSWSSGSKYIYTPYANTLREMGYVVVVPDYRKYPYVKADAMYDDVRRAIRWAYDNADDIRGDKNAIHVMGHSAGAHLASYVTLSNAIQQSTRDQQKKHSSTSPNGGSPILPRIHGLILLAGVYSIEVHLQHETKRGVEQISAMARAMGKTIENFGKNSPIDIVQQHADSISSAPESMPKILFIHGEKDTVVPVAQSVSMYTTLVDLLPKHDSRIQMRLYKKLGHAECVTELMPRIGRKTDSSLGTDLRKAIRQSISG
ncbi:Alpha/Beta hydrolase protein [Syncephalastrum racemosum]|uniref:Alpha/Beta hydrolase protein n=1 Tax=Syncephalastrum racemosum TaxID=13706 RepID=A0A1X2HSS7_SYNRA|nr:Alpha/Beta hydrolase protein [Syncephalastrum racemosum]